jgi:hypothetical protein
LIIFEVFALFGILISLGILVWRAAVKGDVEGEGEGSKDREKGGRRR